MAQPNQVWCAADRGNRIIRGMAVMVEPSSEVPARNPRNSQAGGNEWTGTSRVQATPRVIEYPSRPSARKKHRHGQEGKRGGKQEYDNIDENAHGPRRPSIGQACTDRLVRPSPLVTANEEGAHGRVTPLPQALDDGAKPQRDAHPVPLITPHRPASSTSQRAGLPARLDFGGPSHEVQALTG